MLSFPAYQIILKIGNLKQTISALQFLWVRNSTSSLPGGPGLELLMNSLNILARAAVSWGLSWAKKYFPRWFTPTIMDAGGGPHCLTCRPLHGLLEWPHDMEGGFPHKELRERTKEIPLCLTWPSLGNHTPSGLPDSLSEKASTVVALMDG